MVEPSQAWIEAQFRETVARARRMTVEEKLVLGGTLFDEMCERMRDGIRWQFPDASDERVEAILRARLDLARRLERSP